MTVLAVALASAVLAAGFGRSVARHPGRIQAPNHRGTELPASLGPAMALSAVISIASVWSVRTMIRRGPPASPRMWLVLAGAALVFAAGLADDRWGGGPRGLREHLAAAFHGRATTGLAKLAAGIGAGLLAALAVPGRSVLEVVLAVPVVAGCANLWNGLDVRPGRCLKAFLVAGAGLLAAVPGRAAGLPLAGLAGAGLGALWFDLRERAMLGDAGSNLAGYAVGAALVAVVGTVAGLALAAAVVIALNVAAETVTLSRLIERIPPLRWADHVGRPAEPARSGPAAEKSGPAR